MRRIVCNTVSGRPIERDSLSFNLLYSGNFYSAANTEASVLGSGGALFAAFFRVAVHARAAGGRRRTHAEAAREIAAKVQPDDAIMIYGDPAFESSFPDAPKTFLSDPDLLKQWNSTA